MKPRPWETRPWPGPETVTEGPDEALEEFFELIGDDALELASEKLSTVLERFIDGSDLGRSAARPSSLALFYVAKANDVFYHRAAR